MNTGRNFKKLPILHTDRELSFLAAPSRTRLYPETRNGAKWALGTLGPRACTTYSMIMGTIAYAFLGSGRQGLSGPFRAGIVIHAVGLSFNGTEGVAVKGLATKHAIAAGRGAGEYQGQFANFRELIYVFGPTLLTRVYAAAKRAGQNLALAYAFAILFGYVIFGVLHLTWKKEEMFGT